MKLDDDLSYEETRTSLIKSSWQRCKYKYGFDKGDKIDAIILPEQDLKIHRESCSELLAISKKVIESVRYLAKNGHYGVLVTDSEATTIANYYDSPESHNCAEHGLISGSVWEENLIGTNGIGTSLASQQCMTVNGMDHYANCLGNFTCTAAPIYGQEGAIVGSLNISRLAYEDYAESFFTYNFIKEAANQISANLFLSKYRNDNIISLSPSTLLSLYEAKALLAFDYDGHILDATNDCLQLLPHVKLEELTALHFTDIFPLSMEAFYALQNQPHLIKEGMFRNVFIKGVQIKKKVEALFADSSLNQKHHFIAKSFNKLDRFAGRDRKMQKLIKVGRRIINKNIPILIQGETGAGKDHFTKALHEESVRSDKPFVVINCAGMPETLMDSELFGYQPGTFTDGLKKGKEGKILASNGGTLFLDEIGDMPLNLQARLLRVLEEREVTQLGSTAPIPVDIRVICATHKDLEQLSKQGDFRRDLYYRISGAHIKIPPLRERTNLRELVEEIITNQSEYSYADITITNEVWDLLEDYNWPGNVRELKNALLFALCLAEDLIITLETLPEELLQASIQMKIAAQDEEHKLRLLKLKDSCGKTEAEYIRFVLIQNSWNISATAKQLSVSRSTLHRKMKKYNIITPNKSH